MTEHGAPSSAQGRTTRDRMLSAAVERFARQSYDKTGLREIAADVGVDVAYLHRSFGSKEALFTEALRVAMAEGVSVPDDGQEAIDYLRALIASKQDKDGSALPVVGMIGHSINSPVARPLLRAAIDELFAAPLMGRMGPEQEARVGLVTAMLLGLLISDHVLGLASLQNADKDELHRLLIAALDSILHG